MISVSTRITVPQEKVKQLETRISRLSQSLEDSPGYYHSRLVRPIQANDPYILLTFWQSRKVARSNPHLKAFTSRYQ